MLHFFAKRLREMQEVSRDERGFTLVELLVVIIIIGILAAIAIPVFLSQRQQAWEAAVQSDLRNAASAAVSCSAANDGSFAGCGSLAGTTLSFAAPVQFNQTNDVQMSGLVNTNTRWAINGVNANGGQTFSYDTANGSAVRTGAHP